MNIRPLLLFFLWCFLFFLCPSLIYSQSPEAINYQAVFREEAPPYNLLSDTGVIFQVYIYNGLPSSGNVVYKEEHLAQTNTFGLVNFSIGLGAILTGSGFFQDIDY